MQGPDIRMHGHSPLPVKEGDLEAPRRDLRASWTPAQANFDKEEETYPFLDSIVTMRKIKGYVNDENLMPCTTYSFLATTDARVWSVKLVNLFVFVLQGASYVAVTVSVIDMSASTNRCKFPANVTSAVRASQLLSMMYSILVQDNIVNSLYVFRNGYDEAAMRRSFPECPEHVHTWWYIALFFIFFMGLYAQTLTFIMIMQSTDVLGVLLNYAAVSFIATIDNRMFYLGKRGWLGQRVERHVRCVSLADNPDPKPQWYRRFFHSIAILLIFGGLLAGWVYVVSEQTSGVFLPQHLEVEFSDLVNPQLGTFSGAYSMHLERTRVFSSSRAVYYERRSENALFGYCEKHEVWTFSYDVDAKNFDACEWHAKSSPTETFDVVTTKASQWYGLSGNGRTVPLESTRINDWNCKTSDLCGSHGTCVNNTCQCDEGYWGLECNFPEPCSTLETDGRLGSFQADGRDWASQFKILRFGNRTATVYDKPVYVSKNSNEGHFGSKAEEFDIIFFTGRRWALAFSKSFYNQEIDGGTFESYLENFHAFFSNYTVNFLSEPVDAINDNPSPDGLAWFLANPKHGQGIQAASSQESPAVLLCTECNNATNACYYDEVCQSNRRCKCKEGSTGGLCEVPPIGNGHCDPYFNTVTFDWDGGDCCRATCKGETLFSCGRDPTGFLDLGFYFCKSTDPLPSEPINGEPFSEAGGMMVLADNGYVIAAMMATGKVGLFDKTGSRWIERRLLDTCPVLAMALASGPFAANPIFSPPVVIVISCNNANGQVLTYFCTRDDCARTILEGLPTNSTTAERKGRSVQISRDGDVIAISTRGNMLTGGRVNIYRAEGGSGGSVIWAKTDEVIVPVKAEEWSASPTTTWSTLPSIAPTPTPNVTIAPPQGEEPAEIYEVEDAKLTSALIETKFCPCSGEGYAMLAVPGSSVEWTTYITEEGFYELSTSYATDSVDRPANLLIDGVQVATFNYTATPTWSDWSEESISVELSQGNHTLMIRADHNPGPNIDWLSIRHLLPSESPSASAMPSNFPSLAPSSAPSAMPSVVPNQVVAGISISGDGKALALLVGDIVDGLDVRVHVYQFNGRTWEQLGAPIRMTVCSSDLSSKEAIRLSYDGTALLVSDGNSVKVFDWKAAANEWFQRGPEVMYNVSTTGPVLYPVLGSELEEEPFCRVESIAFSPLGKTVALNLRPDNTDTSKTLIQTFSWRKTESTGKNNRMAPQWHQREKTPITQGSRKGPLSFADNGRELAVGLPLFFADLSGGIRTFEYPRSSCDPGYIGYRVTFTIKPKLTAYSIKVLTLDGEIFESTHGPYFFPNFSGARFASKTQHNLATVVEERCIPDAICLKLKVNSTNFGGFKVLRDGEFALELDSSDSQQILVFGNDTSVCNSTDF